MEAPHSLVKAGKVRALGASAMYGYQFCQLQMCARDHGWTPLSPCRTTTTCCIGKTRGS